MTSTGRVPAAPEPPSGEIVLQPPPEIEDDESSGGVLTSAIPMLGSLGSVALMATMGSPTSQGQERSLLAAGMFTSSPPSRFRHSSSSTDFTAPWALGCGE